MKRAMSKDIILKAINLLIHDILNAKIWSFEPTESNTWELSLEELTIDYDEDMSCQFLMYNQRCEVNSLFLDVDVNDPDAIPVVTQVKYTTYRPEGISYITHVSSKDIKDFNDVQLLSFLACLAKVAFYTCGYIPDWFNYGCKTELEWNELKREEEEDEQ